ncbi:hypothetical protein [Streptomyces sp. NPDC086787]|uniref:hypothetical protein n=1 Tax=Streptomyces sp. NPDC086787 TaxID=3365759 RepID=UPI00382A397C
MPRTGPRDQVLQTPRAAGLAGIVFALLLAAAIILIRLGIPEGTDEFTQGLTDPTKRKAVRTALALVPFAGICFLWLLGVVRAHVGDAEDKFLATVFLGSGLVFIAAMFAAAAAGGAVLATPRSTGGGTALPTWDFGRHFAYTMMIEYSMRMASVFTCSLSVIGHRLGILPRWLTVLGFLTALILLFVAPGVAWAELVFPAWTLLLSAYIFAASGHRGPAATVAP